MKRILLASASIVAFAGAAAAQNISFGGEVELGFNDSDDDDENGFFYSADLNVTFATEIVSGLTTQVTFTIPIADDNLGGDSIGVDDNFVLALQAEGLGGLFFGDTAFAAETHWDPGFAMASDGFSEQDNETVLRGDGTFFGFDMSVSTIIADADNDIPGDRGLVDEGADYIDQISVGLSGNVGLFAVDLAYQEESDIDPALDYQDEDIDTDEGVYDSNNEDFNRSEIIAAAAGATFGGADFKFGYSTNRTADTDSYGVLVRYPFGPVTLSAGYAFEPDFDDDSYRIAADYVSGPISVSAYYENEISDEEYGVEAVYSQSELTTYYVGYINDTDEEGEDSDLDGDFGDDQDEGFYVAARQGLGDNAYVEASYSEFVDAGPNEVREGTTVLVGLTF